MLRRTAQIATLGTSADPVLVGVRGLPVYKLYLMFLEKNGRAAEALSCDLSRVLKVEVEELSVSRNAIFDSVLEGVSHVLQEERGNFEDFLVNVSSGDKPLDFAALVSAFTNGLKAFTVVDNELFMLPMLKFNYEQSLSETKLEILRAIMSVGGSVDSLAKLVEVTGYGKPLLSYHILGAEDSKGLVRLGLVDVHKGPRGTTVVRETTMGRMLAKGQLEVKNDHSGAAWKAKREMLAQAVPRRRNGLYRF